VSLWVRKRYETHWYLGWITNHDTNAKNSEVIWQVLYQDGDKSDYNLAEIADLLLPPDLAQHLKTPTKLLGSPVKKMHGRTTYSGTIQVTPQQKKSNIAPWRFKCEDGETSDYNITELAPSKGN
jgi:hypothetical protein